MVYRLLPGIIEKIERSLRELQLRPLNPAATPISFAKKKSRVFMTPVTNPKGNVFWYKSTLQDWPWVRTTLREEIRIQRAFSEYEDRYKPSFGSPTYITGHDDRHGFVWFLRYYWHAMHAGDMNDEFGFSNQFFRRVSPSLMAKVLHDVRGMTPFLRRRLPLDSHHLAWYTADWAYYQKSFWRPFLQTTDRSDWSKRDVDQLEAWLLEQRAWLARNTTAFTHGDLYPNNIMIRPGSRRLVVLFDWELSHLNVPTFDPVMVYLLSWRRPLWQQEFKKLVRRDLGETPNVERLWNIALLSLGTRLTAFAWHRLTNALPDRYMRLPIAYRPVVRRMLKSMFLEMENLRDKLR